MKQKRKHYKNIYSKIACVVLIIILTANNFILFSLNVNVEDDFSGEYLDLSSEKHLEDNTFQASYNSNTTLQLIDDDVITCTVCNGLGTIRKSKVCSQCNGNGYYYTTVQCSYCVNGIIMVTSSEKCPRCLGGQIGIIIPDCYICSGKGYIYTTVGKTCSYCNGKGTVSESCKCNNCTGGTVYYDVKCTNCGGKGYIDNTYTVQYDANGGANAPEPQKAKLGTSLILSDLTPTHEEYEFLGWSKSSSAMEAQYQPGDSFTANKDTTLYAVWNKPYTILYDANGGEGAPDAQSKNRGEPLILSDVIPIHEEYEFLGWSESSSAMEAQYQPGDSFTANKNTTLYAVWKKIYTITYVANGGTGAPDPQRKLQGETLILSNATPTHENYYFGGWSRGKSYDWTIYQPGDIFTIDEDTTLYAVWNIKISTSISHYDFPQVTANYTVPEPVTLTIQNTGDRPTGRLYFQLTSQSQSYESRPFELLSPNTTYIPDLAPGETFLFTVQPKSGLKACSQAYTDSLILQFEYRGSIVSQVCTFSFTVAPTFQITATAGEGGTVTGSGSYAYKDSVTLTAIPDEGYFFDCWCEDLTLKSTDDVYTFTANSDRTLKALFTPKKYYITTETYVGGSVQGGGWYDYKENAKLIAMSDEGYTFDGWYDENGILCSTSAVWEFKTYNDLYFVAKFVLILVHDFSFLNGEVKISAKSGVIPQDAVFNVIKIAPPPEEAVEKVKDQYGSTATIIGYYEILLEGADGLLITKLDGDLTIRIKLPDSYVSGVGLKILQEDSDGNLVKMESWVEDGYICFKTNWLETY